MSEYGCKHVAQIGKDLDNVPAILLHNDSDPHYVQYFTRVEELDIFIRYLTALRDIFARLTGQQMDVD